MDRRRRLSYTGATERLNNPAVKIGAVGTLTQLSSVGGVTQSIVSGVDMSDLADYGGTDPHYQSYKYDTEQHFRGGETAGRLDVTYALPGGFVTDLKAGTRISGRMDAFNQWSDFGAVTTGSIQGTSAWYGEVPLSPYFSATETNAVQPQYVVFNPGLLHYDLLGVDQAYGIAPAVDNGSADYHVLEHNYAGYFRIDFGAENWVIPMTGNIGMRVVEHKTDLSGELQNRAVYTPSVFDTSRPSLAEPHLDLQAGAGPAAAARGFQGGQLSGLQPDPSVDQPAAGSGQCERRQPLPEPTQAKQFDASLEWYFAPGAALTGEIFYKKLTDFILQETQQNAFTIDTAYLQSHGAIDGGDGSIRGVEVGYQQFYRDLPGLLSGLGTELNYTYIDANAPTAVVGQSTTLPGLSRNSFNDRDLRARCRSDRHTTGAASSTRRSTTA